MQVSVVKRGDAVGWCVELHFDNIGAPADSHVVFGPFSARSQAQELADTLAYLFLDSWSDEGRLPAKTEDDYDV